MPDSYLNFKVYRATAEAGPYTLVATLSDQTTVSEAHDVPHPGNNVIIRVLNSNWLEAGDIINEVGNGGGQYQVISVDSATQITAKYLDIPMNTHYGNVIPVGTQIVPGSFVSQQNPPPGTTYYFKVEANTLNGESFIYNIVSIDGDPVVDSGQIQWVKKLGGTDALTTAACSGVAIDSLGNIIVVGRFVGTVNFGGISKTSAGASVEDIFIAKYNLVGNLIWVQAFGTQLVDWGLAVAVDVNNNIIFTGYFSKVPSGIPPTTINFGGDTFTSNGARDIFLVKFNSNGVHQWSKQIGGTGEDYSYSVAIDSLGDIIICGQFASTVNFGTVGAPINRTAIGTADIFVAKYQSDGTPMWANQYGSTSINIARGICVDSLNNIWVTGQYFSTITIGPNTFSSSGIDQFLLKLNPAGGHLFSRQMFGTGTIGYDVACNSSNQVVVTGATNSAANYGGGTVTPPFTAAISLAKYNSNGSYIYGKLYGGEMFSSDSGYSVAFDDFGNVLITGVALGKLRLSDTVIWYGTGARDAWIAKFDNSNSSTGPNHIWSHRFWDEFSGSGLGISFSPSNNRVVLVGSFGGKCNFKHGDDFSGIAAPPDGTPTTLDSNPSNLNGFIATFNI